MRWLRVAVVLMLVSGCTGPDGDRAAPVARADPTPAPQLAPMPGAEDLLARWDRAIESGQIVLLDDLDAVRSEGQWDTPEHESSVIAGRIEVAGELPVTHDTAVIVMNGRPDVPVRPLGAEQALRRAIEAVRPESVMACGDDCQPVRVIGARPSTAVLTAAGGRVTVPAWTYQLDGDTAQLTAYAVPDDAVIEFEDGARAVEDAWKIHVLTAAGADGPALAITFSVFEPERPCAEVNGQAIESARAVVVLFTIARTSSPSPCPTEVAAQPGVAVARDERRVIPLRRPLGDRVVLDLSNGMPVR